MEASYVPIPQRFGFLFAPISLTTDLADLPRSGPCNLRWPRTSDLCDRFGCKRNSNAFEQIRTLSSVRTDLSGCVGKTGAQLERNFAQPVRKFAQHSATSKSIPLRPQSSYTFSQTRPKIKFGTFKVHVYRGPQPFGGTSSKLS